MGELRERMSADLALKGYSAETRESYLYCARRFCGHYMRPAEELGAREVRCFLLHLLKVDQMGPAGLKMFVASLKFLYEVTLKRPEVTQDLVFPKVRSPLPDILSVEEVMALLEAVGTPKYRALLTTAYATGMRIGETCRLQTNDIDARRGLIHVRRGKGGKDRYVMASPVLLSSLRAYWREARPEGSYLFPAPRGPGSVNHDNVRRALRVAVAKTGIKKSVTTHSLRHAFATHLFEAGVELRTLQQLMGHESIRTTTRYTRVSMRLVADTPSPLDRAREAAINGTTTDATTTSERPNATRRLEARRPLAAKRTRKK